MDWNYIILWALSAFAGGLGIAFGGVLAWAIAPRVTGFSVSRAGMQVQTDDIPVWSGIVDRIERIDSSTGKSIRQGTTGLMILNPVKYGISAPVMLINRIAIAPLCAAAYENHHTRELAADGGKVYLSNKAQDIFNVIRIFQKQYHEITDELSDAFACHWVKKVLIPNLKRACTEKIEFYKDELKKAHSSRTIKNIVQGCLEKNENYLIKIDELDDQASLNEKSSIFNP